MKIKSYVLYILTLFTLFACSTELSAQVRRSPKSTIRGGMLVAPSVDTLSYSEELAKVDSLVVDSLSRLAIERYGADSLMVDSLGRMALGAMQDAPPPQALKIGGGQDSLKSKPSRIEKLFSDSVSLSKMAWIATALPGYGQVYNKQYYKLPIIYGAMGLSIGLFVHENRKYQPLKEEFDALTLTDLTRNDYLDDLQAKMIKSNIKRSIYAGGIAASYAYSLIDATLKYSSNDVSSVKKATTLAMICPGAGQIYNKSYWKLPFVVGGFATMIYVIDWNSRGYTRFKKAYALRYDYDQNYEDNPDDFPDGVSLDEFGGRYSASYLKSIRNSYRRNRDLCIIMTAGLYILQIIDAHVDAHLKDYDISDDLTMNIEPMLRTGYSPTTRSDFAAYGFNINVTF